jgi:hypothetical protein
MKRDARGWIKVEDGLPIGAEWREVLVVCHSTTGLPMVTTGICDGDKSGHEWTDSSFDYVLLAVTHWQPLPELPEELEAQDE